MRPFDFYAPTTVVEALTLLDQYKDSVACIAGGTDLTLELNEWKAQPAVVIDLKKLKELDYIKVENGIVRIGALTSHAEVAANDIIRENVHILYDACRQVGSPQIRNLATLGGNICQSSVAGDGLAACVTLNADVTIKSVRGERTININEFLSSPDRKRNILQPDELMTEVSFPLPDTKHTATAFYKLGKRRALAISVIGGGMVVTVDDNGVCTYCSMRAGAMARYPQRYKSCEEYLVGKKLSWETMLGCLPIMHDQVYEANKSRPSVFYKKESIQGVYKHRFADVLRNRNIEEGQGF